MNCYAFYKNDELICVFTKKFTAIRALLLEKDIVQSDGYDVKTSIYADYIGVRRWDENDTFVSIYETSLV